ncbi:hypothetical protein GCM10027615_18080 [Plantactinospora veratri]
MPYYRSVGEVPRKRHTQFRQPDGSLYAEELLGQEGFSSDSSLLYHRYLPTAIVAAEEFTPPAWQRVPNLPLKPRHLRTHKLDGGAGADAILGRQHLLANDDVRISYVVADQPSPLYRNAIGDECLYVESGAARVESSFGVLGVTAGDYVIIPTSVVYRIVPVAPQPLRMLAIEASGHIGPPKRYLSVRGQFLEHSPTASGTCAARRRRCWSRRPTSRSTCSTAGAGPGTSTPTTPSTWSAGTATSTRGRSPSTTSSRSPAGSTSRRRCTRPSRGRTS